VIAARTHGRLVVLFANDPLLVSAVAAARPRIHLQARSRKELERFIHSTLGKKPRTRVTRRVVTGEPSDQILVAARVLQADLIVVGSHGLTGITRLAFGSTTSEVLKRASVPVLVVPERDRATRRAERSWPRGRIVVPVRLDGRVPADIKTASCVAEWFGCPLLLVHAVHTSVAPTWLRRRLASGDTQKLGRMRRRLADLARSIHHVPSAGHVLEGQPADVVAAIVKRERTPLLLMTLRDRRYWFDAGRGSIAYRIFSQVKVPVLACPPRWTPR
jgi:nucleotide-binding universal stress UspA family protein